MNTSDIQVCPNEHSQAHADRFKAEIEMNGQWLEAYGANDVEASDNLIRIINHDLKVVRTSIGKR